MVEVCYGYIIYKESANQWNIRPDVRNSKRLRNDIVGQCESTGHVSKLLFNF